MAFGDEILEMIKDVKEQELEEITECPVCFYPVEEKDGGTLFCTFCGWRGI